MEGRIAYDVAGMTTTAIFDDGAAGGGNDVGVVFILVTGDKVGSMGGMAISAGAGYPNGMTGGRTNQGAVADRVGMAEITVVAVDRLNAVSAVAGNTLGRAGDHGMVFIEMADAEIIILAGMTDRAA